MTLTASNPAYSLWPEALLAALALVYLLGLKAVEREGPIGATKTRLLAFIGLVTAGSTVLLGSNPSHYTIVAIPLIPAPFLFGALIVRPRLIVQWAKLRAYLTVAVALSCLTWITQALWLYTRT